MKKYLKLFIFLFLFGLPIRVFASEVGTIHVTGSTNYDYIAETLELVNQERSSNGLEPLVMDNHLVDAAILRAKEISLYFDHTRPNGEECFSVSERAYGENIAAGMGLNDTPSKVVDSWMNSEGHRANILKDGYKTIGIGHFQYGRYHFWVQLFGYYVYNDPFTRNGNSGENTMIISIIDDYVSYQVTFDGSLNVGDQRGPTSIVFTNMDWTTATTNVMASDVTWKSSNESVFTVDENGVITALKDGKANLVVTLAGVSQNIPITVGGSDFLYGDLSNDGEVSFTDVIVGLRKVFGYTMKTSRDIEIGDFNHNSDLDFSDIIILLRYIFGYISQL